MTAKLITDAIAKLEAAQEELREDDGDAATWLGLKHIQQHYEIGKAISELKYVLSTL